MSISNKKIDVVYTWVNGDDPDYLKTYNQYAATPKDLNPERIRDIYQLLKYSLRSVEKYAPWVNHIYLVTMRPQMPEWLLADHPKITIVHHDEIFEPEDIPTFNYNVIESYLSRIPGLSDQFIYLNDDFLLGNTVSPDDFFSPEGKVLIHGTLFGENLGWRIYNKKNDIFGLGLIEHSPLLVVKDWWEEMQNAKRSEIDKIRQHKFREDSDVMMYKLYRWYCLEHQRAHCRPIKVWDLLKIHSFHKITNNFQRQSKSLKKLELKRPKFYCLNDDQRDNPNLEVVELVKGFLERMYTEKSGFER
ncbi:MAG: Stealth CR1 domain-containing protein [Cyclobacteriaceae bacterium]|nr:Stealth CR1 domain-containing protein [Cyclobacteriaceae bacterium SS2]